MIYIYIHVMWLWWSCNEILCIFVCFLAKYGLANIKIYYNSDRGDGGLVMRKILKTCENSNV